MYRKVEGLMIRLTLCWLMMPWLGAYNDQDYPVSHVLLECMGNGRHILEYKPDVQLLRMPQTAGFRTSHSSDLPERIRNTAPVFCLIDYLLLRDSRDLERVHWACESPTSLLPCEGSAGGLVPQLVQGPNLSVSDFFGLFC